MLEGPSSRLFNKTSPHTPQMAIFDSSTLAAGRLDPLCFGGPRVYPITRYSGPGGLAAGLSSPLARSHNERPLSAANSATLLAMRAAHSMVPAATLRPDE